MPDSSGLGEGAHRVEVPGIQLNLLLLGRCWDERHTVGLRAHAELLCQRAASHSEDWGHSCLTLSLGAESAGGREQCGGELIRTV